MVGVSSSVIRAWETAGLVNPQRTPSGYRVYTPEEVERLQMIRDLLRGEGLNVAGAKRVLAERGQLPTAPATNSGSEVPVIAQRIRAMRLDQRMSLRELGARANLSPAHISSIEHARSAPSIASLQKLAAALGTNISQLLSGEQARSPDDLLVRVDERVSWDLMTPGISIEELSRAETQLEPLLFRLAPGASSEAIYAHEGEEFLFGLAGTFEITLEETHTYTLGRGDSLTFSSLRPHHWRNPADQPCVVLWINTPPTF